VCPGAPGGPFEAPRQANLVGGEVARGTNGESRALPRDEIDDLELHDSIDVNLDGRFDPRLFPDSRRGLDVKKSQRAVLSRSATLTLRGVHLLDKPRPRVEEAERDFARGFPWLRAARVRLA